jgi:hypothetical protein
MCLDVVYNLVNSKVAIITRFYQFVVMDYAVLKLFHYFYVVKKVKQKVSRRDELAPPHSRLTKRNPSCCPSPSSLSSIDGFPPLCLPSNYKGMETSDLRLVL